MPTFRHPIVFFILFCLIHWDELISPSVRPISWANTEDWKKEKRADKQENMANEETWTHKWRRHKRTNDEHTNYKRTNNKGTNGKNANDKWSWDKQTKKINLINRLRRTYEPTTNKQFERLQPQRRRIFIIASFKNKQSIGGCNKKASFEFPLFLMNVWWMNEMKGEWMNASVILSLRIFFGSFSRAEFN